MADKGNSGHKPPESGNLKNRRIPSNNKKKGKLPPKKIVLLVLLTIFICSSVVVGGYTIVAIVKTPAWDPEMLYSQNQSSIVYDINSEQIAQLHAAENRLPVKFEEIPDIVKKTVVAVEDKRFYEHHGLDPNRLVKAVINDIRAGSYVEGSSTLTMQLAKNAFISDPTTKSLERKIQELILSLKIERNYTKDEILTFYLNRIFFGESSFGIRTAAQTYFGKELKDLNPAEVALLAGLPQAPSSYDPYVYPENAEKRRTIVSVS
jgi:penicillin-binding protein 1A